MPKIYEYFGLVFFFHSNDHEPIHVHVQYNEFENKIEFVLTEGIITDIIFKTIKGKEPIPDAKMSEVKLFIENFGQSIINKWIDFYVLKKKLKNERITKKMK